MCLCPFAVFRDRRQDPGHQFYSKSIGMSLEGATPTVATLNVIDFPFLSAGCDGGFTPRSPYNTSHNSPYHNMIDPAVLRSPIIRVDEVSLHQPAERRPTLSSCKSDSCLRRTEEALKFLLPLRLSWGSTALCLSGGGALAMYHMVCVCVVICCCRC